jgi:hypothetical protein
MRLLRRVAVSVAMIAAFIGLVVVGLIGLGGGLLLVAPLALALVAVLYYRRSGNTEIGWSGGSVGVATATGPVLAVAPRDGVADRAPQVANTRRARMAVVASVARVETRELVASPWLHVGIAFWLVIVVMFGVLFVDDINKSWFEFFTFATFFCHPFAAFAIVAAHRNRTRSRRDGCDEMFDACPVGADVRTLGHLATFWVGAAVNAVFMLVFFWLVATRNDHTYGPLGWYVVAAMLACAVIGAGAVALGVTLGRWAPWGLVPFVAVVAIAVAGQYINRIGEPAYATDRLLATMVATTGIDPIFLPQLWWERVAWLTAISVVVGAIGLLGGRYTRVALAVFGGAGLVALVSALLIVRPATGDADRLAALVADPVGRSTCFPAGQGVEVCVYTGYESLARDAAAELQPVVAAVPDGVLDGVVFIAYHEQGFDRLTAEVQAELAGREVVLPPGSLRLRFNAHPENFEAVRLRMAARAAGLPADKVDGEPPTLLAGRAQGVIALWLATRGLDADARDSLLYADQHVDPQADSSMPSQQGAIWPGLCNEENAVLQWSPTDLDAARAVISLDEARVHDVLAERWDELTTTSATTDDLLVALGLTPLGPPVSIDVWNDICG